MAACKVPEKEITLPSMLHLTVLMLDLTDERRLKQAQELLQRLRPKLMSEFFTNGSIYLSFKGLKTFQTENPDKARVLYFDLKQDEGFETFKKLASTVIGAFVNEGVISKGDLSHIKHDKLAQTYEGETHMTVISLSRGKTFNATAALDKFKDTSLGTISLSELHISSRACIDLFSGQRIDRKDFKSQDQEGYYGNDGSISFEDV